MFWLDKSKESASSVSEKYFQFRVNSEFDNQNNRAIKHFPQIEIRNAMISILKEKDGVIKDSLFDETSTKLGFKRKSTGILNTFEFVFDSALQEGIIKIDEKTGAVIVPDSL